MKKQVLLFLIVIFLIGCSLQKSEPTIIVNATNPVERTNVPDTLYSTLIPTPTSDSRCWEREKECEIAKSIGLGIGQIDSFSPNMKWIVVYDTYFASQPPEKDIGGLRFTKTDGSKEWKFDATQMSQDIGECSNIFITNFWSPDSRYVYFSPDPSYCSRMFNFSDIGTQVLYRLDVETGTFDEYLPFVKYRFSSGYQRWGLYTFENSPNGLDLIYFQSYGSPIVIKIRDLTTENEITYELDNKYLEAGCPAWMDDSRHVLFYAATTTRPGDPTISSLFIIDLDKQTIREIYHDQPNVYCVLSNPYYREDNPDIKNLLPVYNLGINYQLIDRFYLNPLTSQELPWPTSTPYPSSTPQP